MGKLPWTPWYFGDWLRDPALRSVSLAARGLWADMLAIMWESPERGISPYAAGKLEAKAWAKVVGHRADYVRKLVAELELSGVLSRRKGDRKIYCRRMVREELARENARKRQRKHRGSVTPHVTPVSQVEAEADSEKASEAHPQDQVAAVRFKGNGDAAAAFSVIGFPEPFGHPRFQKVFLEEMQKGPDEWTTITLERIAQRCQSEGIGIPPQFFDAKRDVEARENAQVNRKPPL